MRAAGFRPKDTLDTPRVVCTAGYRRLSSAIASIVSTASRRVSSWPVATGKVRQSTTMSSRRIPQRPVRVSTSRVATATLWAAVRAWPVSSIVRAMTAAPCSRTSGMIFSNRDPGPSPSSKLTELTTARPPTRSSPACRTAGSVESSTSGKEEAVANLPTTSAASATPSRPT